MFKIIMFKIVFYFFIIFQFVGNSIQEENINLENNKLDTNTQDKTNNKENKNVQVNCKCPTIFAPVCGSDGKTYHNRCFLKCLAKHRLQYSEECEYLTVVKLDACDTLETHRFKRHDACACSSREDSVCGSNNVTYYNACYLNCAIEYERLKYGNTDLRIKYFGKCQFMAG